MGGILFYSVGGIGMALVGMGWDGVQEYRNESSEYLLAVFPFVDIGRELV